MKGVGEKGSGWTDVLEQREWGLVCNARDGIDLILIIFYHFNNHSAQFLKNNP